MLRASIVPRASVDSILKAINRESIDIMNKLELACLDEGFSPQRVLGMCQAYTVGQDKFCDRCGFVWDINDPEPPVCITDMEHKCDSCGSKKLTASGQCKYCVDKSVNKV